MDGGGLDGLVIGVVEAIEGGDLVGGLDDVKRILVLVVADDSVKEGGCGELEDNGGPLLVGSVARRAGRAHVTTGEVAVGISNKPGETEGG